MSIIRFINDRNREASQLRAILRYATRNGAIKQQYVSGLGINPASAFEEMTMAKQIFHQEEGKQYLHLVISSDQIMRQPGIMHLVGKELAGFYGQYQVLVATHDDTHNLHSHLIVNSVNMQTGKKLSQRRKDFWKFFTFANKVFAKYGLQPIGAEQLYEMVLDEKSDFWDDEDWDDLDAIIHEELEELQSRCGVTRPIHFMDEEVERQDVLRSIERIKKLQEMGDIYD